jgi:Tol biopolymer transport system component
LIHLKYFGTLFIMKRNLRTLSLIICLLTTLMISSIGQTALSQQTLNAPVYLPIILGAPPKIMQIAFRGWDSTNTQDIYMINDDGSQLKNLTSNPAMFHFVWSHDGTRIAFDTNWNGYPDIYIMNADGNGLVRLTSDPASDSSPSWSPDGTRLAFTSTRSGSRGIYVMNTDGSNVVHLIDCSAVCQYLRWSPDGSKIAFTLGPFDNTREIYIMNTDGTGLTNLTLNAYFDQMLEWSPDGARILFLSNRDQGGEQDRADLYHMNGVGTDLVQLTTSGYAQSATWSPEGNKIAVSDFAIGNEGLFIMNLDGSNSTSLLCQSNAILSNDPAWSPDGKKIAYSPIEGTIGDTTGLYVSTIDGLSCQHLTTLLASDPKWKPSE